MIKRLYRAFIQASFFLCLFLLPVAFNIPIVAQQTPNSTEQIAIPRPDADSIVLPVTVMDKRDNYIDGLGKNAFAIYENKVQREITFFDGGDRPLSIGIIFDLSGSMTSHKQLPAAWNGLLRFIGLSHSDNEYFVIAFADRPVLRIGWTRGSKAAAEEFSNYNLTDKGHGHTALYDACYLGLEMMKGSAHSRQAILLISDGEDNDSQHTFTNLRERLKETGVMLYSIGLSIESDPGSSLGGGGKDVMNELSSISGGVAVFPDSEKKIGEFFDRIAKELRHQYLIGFKPSEDKADSKWHKIKIKVTPPPTAAGHIPDVSVRNRDGYYATKNPH
ncbi:MAG: Ca-activated chloride channel [Acidobacteriota bacterium]|jgi:Ca-activated chloride channel family protein|nr:Ca-activated chloride channel [Acidobacteriota bacterium]